MSFDTCMEIHAYTLYHSIINIRKFNLIYFKKNSYVLFIKLLNLVIINAFDRIDEIPISQGESFA